MSALTILAVAALAIPVWLAASNAYAAGLRPDDPEALARTTSLGTRIAQTTSRPVHILFVHGMRAEGPGNAADFMKGLCRHAPVSCPGGKVPQRESRTYLPMVPKPDATILGAPVWQDEAEWEASRPFVDRYVFERHGAEPVVVDEVNWWPLLFPLKCRMVVAPESQLSGADKPHLALCFCDEPPYHRWLTQAQYDKALKGPTVSGGGALVNRALKREILNWGLADAVIALGPMRTYFRQAMDKAFAHAAAFRGTGVAGQEFVVVSESLGSFVVMDAAANVNGDAPNAQRVVESSSDLYFFANQFALLELGRIEGVPEPAAVASDAAGLAAPPAEPSPVELLRSWARAPGESAALAPPAKQIISFSDPSDMLTYLVPKLRNPDGSEAAIVVNVFDRNEINWFGIAVDPLKAHTGHSRNKAVLRLIFTPRP